MDSTIQYRLPNHLRSSLKKPIGYLVSGKNLKEICKQYEIIISVGDHVSVSLIDQDVFPHLMIIDYKTRRGAISKTQKSILENLQNYDHITVTNPPGSLTKELMDTIQSICTKIDSSDHIQLIIKGEEDLTALPAILYAPSNATIIYGMPNKGVVIVSSTEEYKEKIRFILSEM